jgi:NAD(P)-dependent dehydrogenase (short-subunit alcohol dehydrogenase family)
VRDLSGRTAVVTGAGGGIGRALAVCLAQQGMAVVVADVDSAALEHTAGMLAEREAAHVAVRTDVSDPAQVEELAAAAFGRFGSVHLLCNNAGVFQGGWIWERTLADWEWVLGVNLWGMIHGVRSFVPRMIEGGDEGHVVNTASIAGLVTGAMAGPYQVSKFAAVALSESLAHDLRSRRSRIGVSVLCPGPVTTGIGSSGRNRPAALSDGAGAEDASALDQILDQMVTSSGSPPEEVAEVVLEAVREGTFLVPTRESYRAQLSGRLEDLLERRLPRVQGYD